MAAVDHDHDHDYRHALYPRSGEMLAVSRAFRANRPGRATDPTQTKTLRKRYAGEAYRRFRELKGLVRQAVIEDDVFGLRESRQGEPTVIGQASESKSENENAYAVNPLGPPGDRERFENFDECVRAITGDGTTEKEARRICGSWEASNARVLDVQQHFGSDPLPGTRAFDFPQDSAKASAFLDWLEEMQARGILDVVENPAAGIAGASTDWQNLYVRQAYSKGAEHAKFAMREIGLEVPDADLDVLFRGPRHADALGMIYTRAYRELRGVTEAMDQQISRVLAEGLSQGWNPYRMAREMNDRIDAIGIRRARLIARTETVRAFNEASLNRFEDMGVSEVGAAVEFTTAGDSRVCPECLFLAGSIIGIDEARGVIPVHPDCRCAWLPAPVGAERVDDNERTST